jgi:hypothetical protein
MSDSAADPIPIIHHQVKGDGPTRDEGRATSDEAMKKARGEGRGLFLQMELVAHVLLSQIFLFVK